MATHSRIFAWRILMERGAGGRAIVRGVTKSQTRLSMRKHWKNNKDSQDRVRVANKRCVASRQVTLQRLALEEQQQNPCVCEAPWGRRGRAASSHTHPHPPSFGHLPVGSSEQGQCHLTGTHACHLQSPLQSQAMLLSHSQQLFMQLVGNTWDNQARVCSLKGGEEKGKVITGNQFFK